MAGPLLKTGFNTGAISWTLAGLAPRLLLPAITLLPILLLAPSLTEPFDRDEGVYATIAQGLPRGDLPYRDYFDHKRR